MGAAPKPGVEHESHGTSHGSAHGLGGQTGTAAPRRNQRPHWHPTVLAVNNTTAAKTISFFISSVSCRTTRATRREEPLARQLYTTAEDVQTQHRGFFGLRDG